MVPRFDPIRTDRLVIRPMRMGDVDALWRRRNDPSIAKYQDWTLPYTRDRADELVAEMVARDGVPPSDGWIQLAIDDADTESSLGDLALMMTFAGRCAEVGYTLDAGAPGRGVATEAANALVAWLFETVGVARVFAMMHPDNLASVRVAEHLGLVFEGHTRNSFWVGDENSDDWIYGTTPEMWRSWVARSQLPPTIVELVEVTHENLADVARLATHRSQHRFVSPMSGSLADALVPGLRMGEPVQPWYRAVVADGEIVGFVMLAAPTAHDPIPYLWRLLIDRMHQRRGVGTRVLDLVIDWARGVGADSLKVSWVEDVGSPAPLYLQHGFRPTGEIDDGETVAQLDLSRR